MTRIDRIAALAIVALLAVNSTGRAAEPPVKIGIPVGLSGANSVVAPSVVQAAQLAAAEINAKGGILGRTVELAVADDRSGGRRGGCLQFAHISAKGERDHHDGDQRRA